MSGVLLDVAMALVLLLIGVGIAQDIAVKIVALLPPEPPQQERGE